MAYTYEEVLEKSEKYFCGDELAAKVFADKYALRDDTGNYLESTPDEMHRRLASEFARIESKYPNPMSEEKIYGLIKEFKYVVPQGSPMSAIGNPYKMQSLSNCFVIKPAYDSYAGILKTDQEQAQLMKRRGGVGHDISNIRPRGLSTANAAGTTDGIGIFMERFSNTCREVAQCVAEGERVLTKRGLVAIEDVVAGEDQVWTKEGWVRVNNVLHNGPKQVWKVTTEEGFEVRTSEDHIFLTEEGGELVERRLKDFEAGDTIITIPGSIDRELEYVDLAPFEYVRKKRGGNSSRLNTDISFPKFFDEELAYLLGYMYGDGSVEYDRFGEPKSICLACSHDWPEIQERLCNIINSKFRCEAGIYAADGAVNTVAVTSKVVSGWLQHNGILKEKAHAIKVPEKVIKSPPSVQMAFLAGFFDADGYASGKKKGYVWATICTPFAKEIQKLLMANGIISKIHVEDRSEKGWQNLNTVCVTGMHAQERLVELASKFSVKIGQSKFVAKRDNYRTPYVARTLGIKHNNYSYIPDNSQNISAQAFLRVRKEITNEFGEDFGELLVMSKVSEIVCDKVEETYDLSLDSEHLFWCEGYYIHNSGRRGALMLTIDCHHPEIRTFINIKKDLVKVTGANISIKWSDEFLAAVENDTEVQLRWPVNEKDNPEVSEYVNAKEIWEEFVDAAWTSAEPGCLYWDTALSRTPSDIYAEYGFGSTSTNPCGEIILSNYDSCRLLLLNAFSFVQNPFTADAVFDYDLFREKTIEAQRLMDDLIDLEVEAIERIIAKIQSDPEPDDVKEIELNIWVKIKESAEKGRRTGLGLTAIGDALAALGIKYGTPQSIVEVESIYKAMALGAYYSSTVLAEERGAFEVYSFEKEKGHPFIEQIFDADPQLRKRHKKFGRRNIALTTTAPAGSVSIETQTSSGIEPVFMTGYMRRKKINPSDKEARVDFVDALGDKWQEFIVYHHGVKKWMEVTGETDVSKSPYAQATANEIDWEAGVDLQAAAQKWVCHAISRTTNLPAEATREDVHKVYFRGWKAGLKGITIYRDGSRSGVLVSADSKKEDSDGRPTTIVHGHAPKRGEILPCEIHHAQVKGVRWTILIGLLNEQPYEIFVGHSEGLSLPSKCKSGFIVKKKKGWYDLHVDIGDEEPLVIRNITKTFSNIEASWATRIISIALRHGTPVDFLVEQLQKDGNMSDINRVMGRLLKKYIKDGQEVRSSHTCISCGSDGLIYEEGCMRCLDCGSSKCG